SISRTNTKDFRHNYSLGGRVALFQPSEKLIQEAEAIAHHLNADYIGVDVLLVNEHHLFNEIEDPVGARMVYQVSDIDIISLFITFIKEVLT
ncbi:MAG: alpha-L-glutamate ligase, partial [Erysipelotrichia bacterium]|nr:alpha-L-glutamate ligase [Erysipelotrichia bacterium]